MLEFAYEIKGPGPKQKDKNDPPELNIDKPMEMRFCEFCQKETDFELDQSDLALIIKAAEMARADVGDSKKAV